MRVGNGRRCTASVAALEKLHAKHVLPGFTDRSAEEREIEAVTSDITRVRLVFSFCLLFIFFLFFLVVFFVAC